MEAQELGGVSDIELIGRERVTHGPTLNKRVGRKSAKLNTFDPSPTDLGHSKTQDQNEEDYVEITMDIQGDSVALHSAKPVAGNVVTGEDEKLGLLGKGMEKKLSFGAKLVRNASVRVKQVSHELKRFTSFSKQTGPGARVQDDRTKSAATHALKGLKFISKTGGGGAGWSEVEKQFEILADSADGCLHRSLFAKCIGMNKESEAFAGELFDALSRRRGIHEDYINKAQLKDFWDQISDPGFDSMLRTFFDMVDKNADGRITEQEIKEIICLSATTNKLSNIQKQAEEYAAYLYAQESEGERERSRRHRQEGTQNSETLKQKKQ